VCKFIIKIGFTLLKILILFLSGFIRCCPNKKPSFVLKDFGGRSRGEKTALTLTPFGQGGLPVGDLNEKPVIRCHSFTGFIFLMLMKASFQRNEK
jgi:hypothetical protein